MIKLIPYPYLNEVCFLSLNEDDKKYDMVLLLAQDTLKTLLGEDFYNEIETQYNTDSLSPDNDTLYENYLKKYLAWQTNFYYLKFANLSATPTGIREFTDENSSVASDVKMYAHEKNVLQIVNQYKVAMINYLNLSQENDSTKFPLYEPSCKTEIGFGITSVSGYDYTMFKVNKNTIANE